MFGILYKMLHPHASLNHEEPRAVKIIVSMATIPPRINKVHHVVMSLLEQTIRPDRIIIFLAKNRFEGSKLPKMLRLQAELFGVEIRFVEDLGPHKKYFYSMSEFPDDIILTVDDDVLYPADLIEVLYESYKKYPEAVSARRCHLMTFGEKGELRKYNEWIHKQTELIDTPSMLLFPTGAGGVLYPPKCLHPEVYNLESFKRLTLKCDDVWLKFMGVLNNTHIVATKPFKMKHVKGSQKCALNQHNVANCGNDVSIKEFINSYDDFLGNGETLLSRIKNSREF